MPPTRLAFDTLVAMLRTRAAEQPDAQAAAFLDDNRDAVDALTYAEIDRKARAIGAALRGAGGAGQQVLLLYAPGLEFVAAFFGCLYAGAVAVPAYPPRPRSLGRLRAMVEDARPVLILSATDVHALVADNLAQEPGLAALPWLLSDTLDVPRLAEQWATPDLRPDDLAFLQYTSGSTAVPRGVMVSHRNLLANSALIQTAFGTTKESVGVSWLPLYHDMGLIGGILQPIYAGFPLTLMSPLTFLQRPYRWLEAISKTGASVSGGPNFAYDLAARKVTPEQRAVLDLSRWQVAFSGAEPVRAETIRRFTQTFAECGFRPGAWYPCYGLAEATLFVTGGPAGRGARFLTVSAAALEKGRVEPAQGDEATRTLVGCGRQWPEQPALIVDGDSLEPKAAGEVGEIWVSGASVAEGYWNREAESQEIFRAQVAGADTGTGYLRTGDLGFFDGDDLFITGRIKDLIIVDGRNHYPQDIEQTVETSHIALRENGAAAFSVDISAEEQLIVVAEVEREHMPGRKGAAPVSEIVAAARRAVAEQHQVALRELVLIKTGHLLRTTSGKVQRRACRQAYLEGSLARVDGQT
jgi:acyl-CoA synthetase (AMP-forming)/AMP-acid ligase II